ncbi:hypothetical protein H9P43_009096 [Blastocladiella emersonii ATCC 22665]|nr:hypothetical protein H9P43_009096 [Blastocladiella emersonii ATCC 22665]
MSLLSRLLAAVRDPGSVPASTATVAPASASPSPLRQGYLATAAAAAAAAAASTPTKPNGVGSPVGSDSAALLDRFHRAWSHIQSAVFYADTADRGTEVPVDDAARHLSVLVATLVQEAGPTDPATTSSASPLRRTSRRKPCLDYLLTHHVLDKLVELSENDQPAGLRGHVIRAFTALVARLDDRFLIHDPVHRASVRLIHSCLDHVRHANLYEHELFAFAHVVCDKVHRAPELLWVLFHDRRHWSREPVPVAVAGSPHTPSRRTLHRSSSSIASSSDITPPAPPPLDFPLFEFLLRGVHRDGFPGTASRASLVLLLAHATGLFREYLLTRSEFLDNLAASLSALFAALVSTDPQDRNTYARPLFLEFVAFLDHAVRACPSATVVLALLARIRTVVLDAVVAPLLCRALATPWDAEQVYDTLAHLDAVLGVLGVDEEGGPVARLVVEFLLADPATTASRAGEAEADLLARIEHAVEADAKAHARDPAASLRESGLARAVSAVSLTSSADARPATPPRRTSRSPRTVILAEFARLASGRPLSFTGRPDTPDSRAGSPVDVTTSAEEMAGLERKSRIVLVLLHGVVRRNPGFAVPLLVGTGAGEGEGVVGLQEYAARAEKWFAAAEAAGRVKAEFWAARGSGVEPYLAAAEAEVVFGGEDEEIDFAAVQEEDEDAIAERWLSPTSSAPAAAAAATPRSPSAASPTPTPMPNDGQDRDTFLAHLVSAAAQWSARPPAVNLLVTGILTALAAGRPAGAANVARVAGEWARVVVAGIPAAVMLQFAHDEEGGPGPGGEDGLTRRERSENSRIMAEFAKEAVAVFLVHAARCERVVAVLPVAAAGVAE